MIEILSMSPGLLLQDVGRNGWRRFGVPSGGAMDQRSMALANDLLGNPRNAPVLEVAHQGAQLRILQDTWLALAGADFCSDLESGSARIFRAGDVLNFDQKAAGLYAYVAASGGFHAEKWLGSASTDLRNGMGRRLKKGDRLESMQALPSIDTQGVARRISSYAQNHIHVEDVHFLLYPGPQYETFDPQVRQQFIDHTWRVSTRSDRTGYRLEGEPLKVNTSIPSEPVLPGSIQVPSNGQPIITMRDGPTVGGYPQIGIMRADDLDSFAQCVPGTKITFSWTD